MGMFHFGGAMQESPQRNRKSGIVADNHRVDARFRGHDTAIDPKNETRPPLNSDLDNENKVWYYLDASGMSRLASRSGVHVTSNPSRFFF